LLRLSLGAKLLHLTTLARNSALEQCYAFERVTKPFHDGVIVTG
jgi:hypothetical protein